MNHITYQVITTLKETEKSIVMLAMMDGQDDPVIIKRMKAANAEIFRAMSEINNVHIPRIYAMECIEDELVIAEEYVDGETLEFYLNESSFQQNDEQKMDMALQLCEAVKVLHDCTPQIIHRDIKPSNVLITEEGLLKLIDFDASRQYKKMSSDSDTRILGTADYASPEQFGYKQTDVRSDIYSMGIVFEMMNFHGKGLAAWMWKHVIDVCTSFDPKKRYKNIQSLVADIQRVIALQKYQWFYLGVLLCIVVLLGLGIGGIFGRMENTNVPVIDTQSDFSREPTQEEDIMLQIQLEKIEQQLKDKSAYVEYYHQGINQKDKLFLYSSRLESLAGISRVMLTDMVTGECETLLEEAYGFENAVFYLTSDFLQTLQSTYYRLQVEFVGTETDTMMFEHHFRVYASDDAFEEGPYVLAGNYLDYCYEVAKNLHTVLRLDNQVKIQAVYMENGEAVSAEQYRILFDGKGIELTEAMLEVCKNRKETRFIIEFDDGRREILTIANPYLQ